jgi:hypothetical protein
MKPTRRPRRLPLLPKGPQPARFCLRFFPSWRRPDLWRLQALAVLLGRAASPETRLPVRGKSPPCPFSTWATPQKAEVFEGR